MAFQSGTQQGAIWSVPADTNRGQVTGSPEKLTAEKVNYGHVASTPGGKILTFSSNRMGSSDALFWRDMPSGQERAISTDEAPRSSRYALINASATEVIYTLDYLAESDVYVISAEGGGRRKICGDCGPTSSLSPGGKEFLESRGEGSRPTIDLVDVESGKRIQVLRHSKYPLGRPRFSPDGKWIVFLALRGATMIDVMLAPFRGATSIPERDWISITPTPGNVNQAFWSPDGGLLYYVINAGGSYSLMAPRLDNNQHVFNLPFRVYEFTGRFHPSSGLAPLPMC